MSKRVQPRRICALFAAYVIALQALLLPLSVAAGASFDITSAPRPQIVLSRPEATRPVVPAQPAAACFAVHRF